MTGLAIVDTETVGLNAAIHGIWEVAVILHTPPDKDGKAPADEEYLWQLPVDLMHADPEALRISRYYQRRWRMPPPMPPGYDASEWFTEATIGYNDDLFLPRDEPVPDERFQVPIEAMTAWATQFAGLTADRILVGAVPSFDEKRLTMLMRANAVAPAWHYRPICVETLAAGYLRGVRGVRAAVEPKLTSDVERRWYDKVGLDLLGSGDVVRGNISLPWSSTRLSAGLGIRRGRDSHTALGDCRWVRDLWVKIMEDA